MVISGLISVTRLDIAKRWHLASGITCLAGGTTRLKT
jgi:hypothetical protein